MQPVATFSPELASLNMGSMNFGLYPMLERFTTFEHEWEREALEKTRDLVFKNTFADIERILEIGNGNGTRFEFECYDISHLNNLAHFHGRGLARGPLFVQSVFGLLGGIGGHPEDLMHMRRTADRLLGDGVPVVDPGRRAKPDAAGDHRRRHGLPRPGRPRGLAVDRARPAGRLQRAAGHPDPHHPRSPQLRGRHPR